MSAFPYESQWGDIRCNSALLERGEDPASIRDWRLDGYSSAEAYRYWAMHVCGLACLLSVLKSWRPDDVPTMAELVDAAVDVRALVPDGDTVRGLYYRPFLSWVTERFGLGGSVIENSTAHEHLAQLGPGAVAIVSVSAEIRTPARMNTRQGGHLVLAHGYDGAEVRFHNPSGIGPTAENAVVDLATFERFYAGRGMVLKNGG